MSRNLIIVCVAALFLFIHSLALAGSFRAVPVRIYLDARSKTAVVRIINDGDDKLTLQLEAKSWRQDDAGKDIYGETGEIIFFPKIAEIEKGGERIVRVGYNGRQEGREKTYRLYLQELPLKKPGEKSALTFAVTMALPIYVAPEKVKTDWAASQAGLSEERLRVKVTNGGNEHITVNKIDGTGTDELGKEVFAYSIAGSNVFAGVSRVFEMVIPQEKCLKTKAIHVTVDAERGSTSERMSREVTMNVEKGMCSKRSPVRQKIRQRTRRRSRKIRAYHLLSRLLNGAIYHPLFSGHPRRLAGASIFLFEHMKKDTGQAGMTG